jgi:hypothetical protein
MAARAATLLPMSFSIWERGPMKRRPSFSTSSANPAFSERKPYPGWMASAPVTSAAEGLVAHAEAVLQRTRGKGRR